MRSAYYVPFASPSGPLGYIGQLEIGQEWLEAQPDPGLIVLEYASMADNNELLRVMCDRYGFDAPRLKTKASRPVTSSSVLCCWPTNNRLLEFSESRATGGSMCVLERPGSDIGLAGWIRRHDARSLVQNAEILLQPAIPVEIRDEIIAATRSDGHNNYATGSGKGRLRGALRQLAAMSAPPNVDAVVGFVSSLDDSTPKGVEVVRKYYRKCLDRRR